MFEEEIFNWTVNYNPIIEEEDDESPEEDKKRDQKKKRVKGQITRSRYFMKNESLWFMELVRSDKDWQVYLWLEHSKERSKGLPFKCTLYIEPTHEKLSCTQFFRAKNGYHLYNTPIMDEIQFQLEIVPLDCFESTAKIYWSPVITNRMYQILLANPHKHLQEFVFSQDGCIWRMVICYTIEGGWKLCVDLLEKREVDMGILFYLSIHPDMKTASDEHNEGMITYDLFTNTFALSIDEHMNNQNLPWSRVISFRAQALRRMEEEVFYLPSIPTSQPHRVNVSSFFHKYNTIWQVQTQLQNNTGEMEVTLKVIAPFTKKFQENSKNQIEDHPNDNKFQPIICGIQFLVLHPSIIEKDIAIDLPHHVIFDEISGFQMSTGLDYMNLMDNNYEFPGGNFKFALLINKIELDHFFKFPLGSNPERKKEITIRDYQVEEICQLLTTNNSSDHTRKLLQEELPLNECSLNLDAMKNLCSFIQQSITLPSSQFGCIQHLNLSNSVMRNYKSIDYLTEILHDMNCNNSRGHGIRVLNVSHNLMSGSCKNLAKLLKTDNCLEVLDISYNLVNNYHSSMIFESICGNTTLRELNMEHDHLSVEHFFNMDNIYSFDSLLDLVGKNTTLKSLNLKNNGKLSFEGCPIMLLSYETMKINNKTLTKLDVDGDETAQEYLNQFVIRNREIEKSWIEKQQLMGMIHQQKSSSSLFKDFPMLCFMQLMEYIQQSPLECGGGNEDDEFN